MNKTETETGRILKTLVRELSRKESGKYDLKSMQIQIPRPEIDF